MEFLRNRWNEVKSYFFVARYDGISIISDFVFMQNLSAENWEEMLSRMVKTPYGLKVVKRTVDEAQRRTEQERQTFTKKIMSGKTVVKFGKEAKQAAEMHMERLRFKAEVNSMSQENLDAVQQALHRLATR